MKICFISGVKFGYELLSYMLTNNVDISIVFSYDDDKKAIFSDYASFDDITKQYAVRHIKVKNINDSKNVQILKEIEPDIILVMGWSQLLKKEILSIPKFGTIGSHPTELPKYRGRAPIPWTIIKGLRESALTFFYMTEGTDDGDIIIQRHFPITDDDDASSLYKKITTLGEEMMMDLLSLLKENKINRIPQDASKFIEYWDKRTPENGEIDWTSSDKEILTLIRATTHPYPGAFTFYKKSKLIIWKAERIQNGTSGAPGKILDVSNEGLKVSTGMGGCLLLKKISLSDVNDIVPNKIFSKKDVGAFLGK